MANDFLKDKWRMWFRVLDGANKHKLSQEGIVDRENKLAILNDISGEQKQQMMATVNKLVNDHVFYGKQGPISEDEFVALQDEDFKADKVKYYTKRRNYFHVLFKTMSMPDENASEELFVNALKVRGYEDTERVEQFFRSFGAIDGKVPFVNLVDAWVQYTTCEDSTVPDIVKDGLDRGL